MSAPITAIVVNWNTRARLPLTLSTLRSQIGVDLRVVVVDNASSDGSVDWLLAHAPDVTVVQSSQNEGFAGGVNRGLELASTPYVLLLNPDVALDPDYCANVLRVLESRPRAGSASGILLRPRVNGEAAIVDSLGHRMLRGCWPENIGEGKRYAARGVEPVEVMGICAAAGLYRRSALADIALPSGVFCRTFFAYLEDVDVDFRLRARGWQAVVVPQATGVHERSGTGARKHAFVLRHIVKNSILLPLRIYPVTWLMRDLPLVVAVRVSILVQYAVASPSSLLGVIDALKAAPGAVRERRRIMRGASVAIWARERRWVEPFPLKAKASRFGHKLRRRTV